MPGATLKLVAKLAGVAPVTVSRVVNGSANVATATREKVLATIRDLEYTPNIHAANLRRQRSGGENTGDSAESLVSVNGLLRVGCNCCGSVACPSEGAFVLSVEEGRALEQQLLRLRRDLNQLWEHTQRIQTCVEVIHDAYARRLFSSSSRRV